jgi:very-short-patch-repair endonuclease
VRLRTVDELNYTDFMTPPRLTRVARVLRKKETWAEKLLWSWLRDRRFSSYKFRRQHPFGPHVLDFFCLEAWLDLELDGFQHGTPEQQAKDIERDALLEARGIKVLRFWNSRLRREKEAIRGTIWRMLQERAPHPLPDYCRPMSEGNKAPRQAKRRVPDGCKPPSPSP